MELEKYLQEIETCPDEETSVNGKITSLLTAEFGIYDNFPILIGANYRKIIFDLMATKHSHEQFSGEYELQPSFTSGSREINNIFHYVPGTVLMQVQDRKKSERDNIESDKFSVGIVLHPYQEKRANEHWTRTIAKVITDLGKYAIKNNLPLCLPEAIGTRYLDSDHASKIIYFNSDRVLDKFFK